MCIKGTVARDFEALVRERSIKGTFAREFEAAIRERSIKRDSGTRV
jgi:hypothetical protein